MCHKDLQLNSEFQFRCQLYFHIKSVICQFRKYVNRVFDNIDTPVTANGFEWFCFFLSVELLQNNDMEAGFHGNWFCHSDCDLEHSNDSYSGLTSVKVFNR